MDVEPDPPKQLAKEKPPTPRTNKVTFNPLPAPNKKKATYLQAAVKKNPSGFNVDEVTQTEEREIDDDGISITESKRKTKTTRKKSTQEKTTRRTSSQKTTRTI